LIIARLRRLILDRKLKITSVYSSVIGAAALSSSVLIRKRPSGATSYY
jgi:hypothetical protein